jgi:GDP-L-fucose synthase
MFAGILSTAPVVAKNPVSHIIDNTIMTMQMLEASYFSDVKKFVWLSSTTGYPEKTDGHLVEEDMFVGEPPSNYYAVGNMSRFLETQCKLYAEVLRSDMSVHVLRPTQIYGEFETFDVEKSHFLPALVKRVVDGCNPIEVWGDGSAVRDLVYSDDVLDACLLSMSQERKHSCYNVGSGRLYSVKEILERILKLSGREDTEIAYDISKPSSVSRRTISIDKIRDELAFSAKTSIDDGISRVIDRYRQLNGGMA